MKIKFSTEKGQSLLEIAVSLGLVALIITILTITTLNGLKNSQFAKNQVLASSYAQQGVELVKVMRQKDCPVSVSTGEVFRFYNVQPGQFSIWENPPRHDAFKESIKTMYFQATSTPTTCQMTQNNIGESFEDGLFIRRTKLENISPGVLRVTVEVSWSDFSGPHVVQNISLITNYE